MKTTSLIPTSLALSVLLSTLDPQFSTVSAQGTLAPPGAPAPTMKSLDQIEPRIPISAGTTPGGANDSFIITNPGSYYLTTNFIATSPKNGIQIAADGVTIDLCGFELNGAGLGGVGIRIITSIHRQNLTIRNGSVRNWTSSGIDLSFGRNLLLENVLALGNGGNGIYGGENAVIRDCLAYTNANAGPFLAGISANQGSVVVNCAADFNGISNTNCFGIVAGTGSTVSHCSASQNSGPNAVGISASAGCTVSDCAVTIQTGTNGAGISVGNGSSVIRCTVSANPGSGTIGIQANQRVLIESCVTEGNGGDGIRAASECAVVSNVSGNNGGAGIHTTGQRNRIDNNNVTINAGGGIKVDSTLSLITRNSVSGNSVNNYITAAGNNDAEQVGGGTAFTSTDPWANFSY